MMGLQNDHVTDGYKLFSVRRLKKQQYSLKRFIRTFLKPILWHNTGI